MKGEKESSRLMIDRERQKSNDKVKEKQIRLCFN